MYPVPIFKGYESGRSQCSPQLWYYTQARLAERNKDIKQRIEEHCRKWNSKAYRNKWRRNAREKFGD
jgi:hypothetical protein